MGKQRKQGKRWQGKRWQGNLDELGQALKEEDKVVHKVQPEKDGTKRTKLEPTTRPTVETRAGKREYDQFFSLYAKWIRECKEPQQHFLPLGFIPGPAAILETGNDEVRVTDATPDVKEEMAIPSPRMKSEELPEKIREALTAWRSIGKALGSKLSPWNLGLAKRVFRENPPKELIMAMTEFRYRSGDPPRRFGVKLTLGQGGMLVEKIYNPDNVPDISPPEGTFLSWKDLQGKGAIQKLRNTWDLMERNYLSRYDRDGNRLQRNDRPRSRPPDQRPQYKRPT